MQHPKEEAQADAAEETVKIMHMLVHVNKEKKELDICIIDVHENKQPLLPDEPDVVLPRRCRQFLDACRALMLLFLCVLAAMLLHQLSRYVFALISEELNDLAEAWSNVKESLSKLFGYDDDTLAEPEQQQQQQQQ